jgi:hypothetical protein
MKKLLTLIVIALSVNCVFAQSIVSLAHIRTMSKVQVDSALNANGISASLIGTQNGVEIYKVIYNTLSWDSTPTIASGLLCVPVSDACNFPVISYQHGTMFRKEDAPSRFTSTEGLIGLVSAATGTVGLVPDYLGLGDGPGLHPYQHAATEAYAVIDLLRSARQAQDTFGYKLNGEVFLFGYSQGGHATMAAQKFIETKLNGEFTVTAAAPMSGAFDMGGTMVDVMLSNNPYPDPSYLPYIIISWNPIYNLYTSAPDIFTQPYDTVIPPLYDGATGNWIINANMPNVPKLVLRQDQIDSFTNTPTHPLRLALEENKTFDFIPQAPIRMFYCMGDQSVNYLNSIVAQNYFVSQGLTNTAAINVDSTLDHVPCAQFSILGAKIWFDSLRTRGLLINPTFVNESTPTSADGSVAVNPFGGAQPLQYSWSNGATTPTLSGLSAGQYSVTVTDATGCSKNATVNISVINGINGVSVPDVKISLIPNPANSFVVSSIQNIQGLNYTAGIYDINGRLINEVVNTNEPSITWNTKELSGGIYYLKFILQGNKVVTQKLMIAK